MLAATFIATLFVPVFFRWIRGLGQQAAGARGDLEAETTTG